jgi:hypothetical protein
LDEANGSAEAKKNERRKISFLTYESTPYATIDFMARARKRRISTQRYLIIGGALATAVLVLGASLALNTSRSTFTTFDKSPKFAMPMTGFGGYTWRGSVKQISAKWRVPAISIDSPTGSASTWIGAQGAKTSHFIQIGVVENRLNSHSTVYEAFWSDAKVGFTPQILGSVDAGDLVFASMNRNKKGWDIKFVDPSRTLYQAAEIFFHAGSSFTHAEWIQEDPTQGNIVASDVAYPDIKNVQFQRLRANDHAPHLGLNDAKILITSNGNIRVPTSVRHDSFTFDSPKGAALQYLLNAKTLDVSSSAFSAELARWSSTSNQERSQDTKVFIDALRANEAVLEAESWPKSTRRDMSKLVKNTKHQVIDLEVWSSSGLKKSGPAYTKYFASVAKHHHLVNEVRASLGLPPAK